MQERFFLQVWIVTALSRVIELTNTIASNVSIPVIASGGAGSKEHFLDAFTKGKADAALAASLFHYKELDIMELKKYLADNGIPMRM